jgi:hypothetical protein
MTPDERAEALAGPHLYVDDDTWYSCSQGRERSEDEPGSGCADDDRRGKPCDCGRDARVKAIAAEIHAAEERGRREERAEIEREWITPDMEEYLCRFMPGQFLEEVAFLMREFLGARARRGRGWPIR